MILSLIVSGLLATAPNGGEAVAAPRVAQPEWTVTDAPMRAHGELLVIVDSSAETPDGDVYTIEAPGLLPVGHFLLDGLAVNFDPYVVGIRSVMMPEDLYALAPGEMLYVTAPVPVSPSPSATTGCTVVCASGYFACCSASPLWCHCKPLSQQHQANCPQGGPGSASCTAWSPAGGGGGGGGSGGGGGGGDTPN